ncbi:MAG: glycoside hydrolase family 16 protein [Mycobacterium sp.]|nr:glycoside hydrolase family 16 protein [Mycobacterium sp.]
MSKRRKGLLAALFGIIVVTTTASLQGSAVAQPVHRASWHMIWNDEFGGATLNTHKWNAEYIASPRNNELEYYIPRNAVVRGGHLSIISKHESYQGQDYTSAAIDTYQKFSFTYGKVVIRAKLPQMGQGIWPALWMEGTGCNPVGSPCPWPLNGANEIDILEAINTPSTMYMTPHWGSELYTDLNTSSCTFGGVDFSAAYHTFSMVWKPGGLIDWYVDGVQRCERSIPGYFHDPMYLIFNTAIGGSFPGNPDATTPFPQSYDIDYVRVYQSN